MSIFKQLWSIGNLYKVNFLSYYFRRSIDGKKSPSIKDMWNDFIDFLSAGNPKKSAANKKSFKGSFDYGRFLIDQIVL